MRDLLECMVAPGRVAHVLGVKVDTLAAWRRRGFGPEWVRVGRQIRYPESSLNSWINSQPGKAPTFRVSEELREETVR